MKTGGEGAALVGAAIFAVHPIQSEAVANVSFREDLLCALFSLLAVVTYLMTIAYATLSKIWAEQKPHMAGSPDNAVIRDRIVAELTASGYQPEIQKTVACGPADRNPGCSPPRNRPDTADAVRWTRG